MSTNAEVLEIFEKMRPIEEGENAEYIIVMPEKLLGITKHWIEHNYQVMVNILGMKPYSC